MDPLRFYLVRHADSERGGPDAARRLTAEGRARFEAQVRALASELAVRRVLASPLARAVQTGELLEAPARVAVEREPALGSGESTGGQILALGRGAGDGAALVGHNPEIGEAIALAGGRSGPVPPGTIAAVEAADGGYRVLWVRSP